MKQYTFEIVVTEGNSEYWEEVLAGNQTGCDEVRAVVINSLFDYGIEADVKLVKYEDK